MAERYNQAINNWSVESTTLITQTWGNRNDVVVAINGFYYGGDVEPPGVPWSGQVQSGWYSKLVFNKIKIQNQKKKKDKPLNRKGHHPNCSSFKHHTIQYKKKIYCAGCLGLALGCISAIILMIGYIANLLSWFKPTSYGLFLIAPTTILLVFISLFFLKKNAILRVIINIIFIIGFFILVITIFEYTKNLSVAVISLLFCILFMQTRIQLSQYNHQDICKICRKSCTLSYE